MARNRTLQQVLSDFCENVYFQPPEGKKLKYPCIIYQRERGDTKYANDRPYNLDIRYSVTVIDRKIESEIFKQVAMLPTATYDRHFEVDGLHHDVITLYY